MAQISDEVNIDKIDKFLVICQNFSYQIILANVALGQWPQFHQYFIHQIFLNANFSIFPSQRFVPYCTFQNTIFYQIFKIISG